MIRESGARAAGIAAILVLIRAGPEKNIEHVVDSWHGNGVFRVMNWPGEDGNYALHINMRTLGSPGEEALLPFSWVGKNRPSVTDAIFTFRNTNVTYKTS